MTPIRVQRKRTRGFKLPPNTVCVTRGTKWGNPFRLTNDGFIQCYSINRNILDPWIMWSMTSGFDIHDIVDLYEKWIKGEFNSCGYLATPPNPKELKGKNVACFCKEGSPCHGDVLIQLSNKP